jgi:ferredoxin
MAEDREYVIVERSAFDSLFELLESDGYTVVAPTVREGAILYDRIGSAGELPAGRRDHHDAGKYRLSDRNDQALFGYVVGADSLKRFLYPPRERLCAVRRQTCQSEDPSESGSDLRYAFVGVRACELAAVTIQDRVLRDGSFADPRYGRRREQCLIVAVDCTEPGGTCFCTSMGTGPGVRDGYDLGLTEMLEDGRHFFVAHAQSERGRELLARWGGRAAQASEVAAAASRIERAAQHMGRQLDTEGLAQLLQSVPDHPRWDDVAQRCLNCANCTLVCPTCFCCSVEDTTDLSGEHAERWRQWDSCFTLGFSYIHGGSVRASAKSRYRQWLTHKLSSWYEQFGTQGCVGCGRCITWCPVGIDLTAEARALAGTPAPAATITREQ